MSENVPRLELLRFLRRVQEQQLQQTDRWIHQEEQREAAAARAELTRPPADPGWCVSYGIGADRRPIEVHIGDCRMAKHRKAVSEEDARRAIGEGLEACQFCRPDTVLGLL
ncbi:DUF6233 domain-containing protein [Streptomyces sp. SLBN-118]|uniref:DUF6233 domain-containing protein n=1 Tax=Streptomyces sp. SLBN-118 TaxID=2768454 RepID=UPI00114E8738|nr:DUF6233 domain-containing protein [Streptomyces sp. SLBN-118]